MSGNWIAMQTLAGSMDAVLPTLSRRLVELHYYLLDAMIEESIKFV